ncbi:MAG: rhamnan synthesis F family protein [Alphaproteobacteria bacterium]|nr:rhamnan synthesis F family protein [Alphaproteobacteria bacterium]
MENKKKRIIVVLGMHRSGTSALTRGLKVLGVDLGDNFWPATSDNEKGFWEVPDIVLFNESLLKKLNLTKNSNHYSSNIGFEGMKIRPINRSTFENKEFNSYLRSDVFLSERQIAIDILKDKLKDDVVFGFKDPRVSILLPFWQSVFEELNLDDSYIISVRNPLNIAESLLKRNNIPIDVSMLLWYKHILSSIVYTQDKKNVFVHYDDLLEDPKHQLDRISQFLLLPIPESSLDELEEYSHNFLTSSLRNHEYSADDLKNNINVPKLMTDLYLLLDNLSKDVLTTHCDAFKEQWKIVEGCNSEYMPLLTIIDRLEKDQYDLIHEKVSLGEERDILIQEKDKFIQERSILTQERDMLTQERDILAKERGSLIQEKDSLIQKRDDLTHEREILTQERGSLIQERDSLIQKRDDLTQERDNLTKERDDIIREREILTKKRDGLIQERNSLIQIRASLTQERDNLTQEKYGLIQEMDGFIQKRDILIQERNDLIHERDNLTQERNGFIQERNIIDKERSSFIQERDEFIQQRNDLTQVLNRIAQERDHLVQEKEKILQEKNNLSKYLDTLWDINQKTTNSLSWKVTRPFRFFKKFIIEPKKTTKSSFNNYILPLIRFCYYHLPMSYQNKIKIKNVVLKKAPFLFRQNHEAHALLPKLSTSQKEDTFIEDNEVSIKDALDNGLEINKNLLINFDSELYLALYPDLAIAKVDPVSHYINHGIKEGRIGGIPFKVRKEIDPKKETVLIVSHEASRTGAPVLAWNIAIELKNRFNIVILLLGPGNIQSYFEESSNVMYGPFNSDSKNYTHMSNIINKICKSYDIKFALVNSIESRCTLQPLDENNIPNVLMIHEFFSDLYYTAEDFLTGLVWSGSAVFSAELVRNSVKNALSSYQKDFINSTIILPQGKSKIPVSENNLTHNKLELSVLKKMIYKNKYFKPFIVLGGGTVQDRKGVDLFFETASEIKKLSDDNIVFLWFGHECGNEYYEYIKNMINKKLSDFCYLLDPIENFEDIYVIADLFFLSSRLDPMPNVVIDAMHNSIPIICFSGTSGIEEILNKNEHTKECVVPHLNVKESAIKILEIYKSKKKYKTLSKCTKELYSLHFDMKNYINQLINLAECDADMKKMEKKDLEILINTNDFKKDFYLSPFQEPETKSKEFCVRSYLIYSKKISSLGVRKVSLGFNDNLYIKLHTLSHPAANPLADYIQSGRPNGPWDEKIIDTSSNIELFNNQLKCALHIHVFYPELLEEIIKRLMMNDINCDLFISAPSNSIVTKINKSISFYNKGKIVVKSVPNKGRNFGPLFSAFSNDLSAYDIVGHFHTKKSTALLESSSDTHTQMMIENWRIFLLENLMGGLNCSAKHIMNAFDKDKNLGLVFPFDANRVGWTENKPFAEELAKSMKISDLPDEINSFPIGSMFWARPKALKPLFDLDLTWDDYPEEPLPYDGSMLHAIERILPIVANHQGYEYALVHTPGIIR